VLTALELDIFNSVAEGANSETIAQRIQADMRATEMLLNVLVSLKLLEKKNGRYFNSVTSARFFSNDSPDNARPGLLHSTHLWHTWSTLTEAVRAGTSVVTRTRDEQSTQDFIAAMDRNAKERAASLVKAVGIHGARRMLDLGGGSGAYSIAFVQASPTLHSEILDVPAVVPITQSHIQKAGLAGRISIRAGDMLSDSFGENLDLVLVSAICHMFSADQNRALFQRAFKALASGGRFVIQDFILDADKTSPRFAALFSLNMLVGTRSGASYSEPEYTSWLREAGFSNIRRVSQPGPASLLISTRP
jgi:predicted O-methyltransferase YrrM